MANIYTQRAADTFLRPIAANLGPTWAAPQGSQPIQITNPATGNAVATTDGSVALEYFVGAGGFPPDQWAECKIVARANTSCLVGVIVRGVFGNTVDGYFGGAFNAGATYRIYLARKGNYTLLATSASNVTLNDVVRLAVQGTLDANGIPSVALTLFVNGVSNTTFTDTGGNTGGSAFGGQPGLMIQSSGGLANALATNFNAGVITAAPTVNNAATALILGGSVNLGNLTGLNQVLQFTVPSRTELYLGRLQMVVTSGIVANPIWVLTCSQDGGTTWFMVPSATVPTSAPLTGDLPSLYGSWYDVSGLGGALFHFGLLSGNVTGNLAVNALIG